MSLIEKNALILAKLEEEWSDVGPLRQIEFQGRFCDYVGEVENALPPKEAAERFVVFAKEQGCKCSVRSAEFGDDLLVTASKKMEPTAANVTSMQERLTSFVEEIPGGYFDGWNYSSKPMVRFAQNNPKNSTSNISAARNRAEILFGGESLPAIRPASSWDKNFLLKTNPVPVFALVPSEFIRRAQDNPPKDPQPTASAFSQWVYSLYGNAYGSDDDRDRGKEAEEDILERRTEAISCNGNTFLRRNGYPWNLVHNGLHLNGKEQLEFFEIPRLIVKGKPLRASPDLLYENKNTSEVIIVEIKFTKIQITKNLWPNIWAQLWCYSHIDIALSANKVTVIGEAWSDSWYGRHRTGRFRLVNLIASVRRNPRAPAYDRFFRKLFQIYSGS